MNVEASKDNLLDFKFATKDQTKLNNGSTKFIGLVEFHCGNRYFDDQMEITFNVHHHTGTRLELTATKKIDDDNLHTVFDPLYCEFTFRNPYLEIVGNSPKIGKYTVTITPINSPS